MTTLHAVSKFTFVLILLMSSMAVHAASVLPLGLERLLSDAEAVFNGRCISNQVERDVYTNMVVTYTTFEVIDVVKGQVSQTHTIKQIGGYLQDSNVHMRWPGIPKFSVGEEYVIFLPPKSNVGFSSPVGLEQGKFSVLSGDAGKEVTNGKDFQQLTKNVASKNLAVGVASRINKKNADKLLRKQVSLTDFMETLRNMESEK